MTEFNEKRLRDLEEALRWSAQAHSYTFEDPDAFFVEGLVPEYVQSLEVWRELDEDPDPKLLPAHARFFYAAILRRFGDAFVVSVDPKIAADSETGELIDAPGAWSIDEVREWIRRQREAASGS